MALINNCKAYVVFYENMFLIFPYHCDTIDVGSMSYTCILFFYSIKQEQLFETKAWIPHIYFIHFFLINHDY